jgi:hypothetical protein
MTEYFQYGEKELAYLKQRDKRLSEIIDKVGWVKRRVIPNLFAALVHSIVGQHECEGGCTEDRKENDVFSSVPVAEKPSEQSPYGQCREKSE